MDLGRGIEADRIGVDFFLACGRKKNRVTDVKVEVGQCPRGNEAQPTNSKHGPAQRGPRLVPKQSPAASSKIEGPSGLMADASQTYICS